MGCFIRDGAMQIKPGKQHEIEPNLQGSFQLGVGQPVPLTNQ